MVSRHGSPAAAYVPRAMPVGVDASASRLRTSTGALNSSQSTPTPAQASRRVSASSQRSTPPKAAAARMTRVPSRVFASSAWLFPTVSAASLGSGIPRPGKRAMTRSASFSSAMASSGMLPAIRFSTPLTRREWSHCRSSTCPSICSICSDTVANTRCHCSHNNACSFRKLTIGPVSSSTA